MNLVRSRGLLSDSVECLRICPRLSFLIPSVGLRMRRRETVFFWSDWFRQTRRVVSLTFYYHSFQNCMQRLYSNYLYLGILKDKRHSKCCFGACMCCVWLVAVILIPSHLACHCLMLFQDDEGKFKGALKWELELRDGF